jgi:hypothetical protein
VQRAGPYCGENPGPDKDVEGELDLRPGIKNNQDPKRVISWIEIPPRLEFAVSQQPPDEVGV